MLIMSIMTVKHLYFHAIGGYENTENIKLLLDAGADVNQQNKEGGTALHLTSWKGNIKYATVLIESGSEINKKDYREQNTSTSFLFR